MSRAYVFDTNDIPANGKGLCDQNGSLPKWAEGESAAQVIFQSLADAGVDFIHVTEHKALEPAFDDGNESLASMARRFAPKVAIIANGGINDSATLEKTLEQGADVVALGKMALSNPNFPQRLKHEQALMEFDSTLLSPTAHIKSRELESAESAVS